MASFNGVDLGLIFEMNTAAAPKAFQVRAYPGANGLEVLDMGSRGGMTTAEGAVFAGSPTALAGALASLRALQVDGGSYVLIDTLGTSWSGVKLMLFQPIGKVFLMAVGPPGGYGKMYHAEFFHTF